MSKVILVTLGLCISLNGQASGNVNSSVRFPVKNEAQEVTSGSFKCESGESLKSCLARFKAAKKMKMKEGGM